MSRWRPWRREVVASMTETSALTGSKSVSPTCSVQNRTPADEPVDAEIVDDTRALVLARPPMLPAVSSAQVADLRDVLAPHVDPAAVELVAAVVVGAAVLARQRQQRSGAAFLEAHRRRAVAEGWRVPASLSWRERVGWTGPGAA